jgi:transcriptional regulator with GAF, ATPase, and Fis domain/CHASE2 domain-containing sensor protein
MTTRTILWVAVPLAGIVLLALLGRSAVSSLDDQALSAMYSLRGTRQADTAIVIVYVDQDAIKSLGWPVRRNFHALMVKALTDLHAAVVGIEPVFEDPKPEYAEYDELLARMIGAAGNVVLTAYVDTVGESGGIRTDTTSFGLADFPGILYRPPPAAGPHLPLRAIRLHAAGVGHVNIAGTSLIDPFLNVGQSMLPAFSLEVIRVLNRTGCTGVVADGTRIMFRGGNPRVAAMTGGHDGRFTLNYPGGLGAFRSYPFLEVLRSYDNLRIDKPTDIPVADFKGKIVLISIIGEGRSEFLSTPVDPRLPAILYHAAVIDNALSGRFLTVVPFWMVVVVTLLAGFVCGWGSLITKALLRRTILTGTPVAIFAISFVLFAWNSIYFPFVLPVAGAIVAGVGGLTERHRRDRLHVTLLTDEKRAILERLRDREAKVELLERELTSLEAARASERGDQLLDELKRYKEEIRALSSQADDLDVYEPPDEAQQRNEFEGMIYNPAGPMSPVIDFVAKIASSDAPVLILGESGTGKELVARALHRRSARAGRNFIAVNCGALAESLLESELFGHEKGSFTGAVKDRLGRFELADGGTIFLDEIGEVSEGFQLKLLRVLQQGEFERVGGVQTLRTNVRVVAATNKDLKVLVRQRKFREDLYYRLNVLGVQLPPLRERSDDIRLLAEHFLAAEAGSLRVSRNVMDVLRLYGWPGNVRELESVITRGGVLARAEKRGMITLRDLPDEVAAAARKNVPVEEQVMEAIREKGFSRSSVSGTADELGGLNRGTVAEYLRGECLKSFAESVYDVERAVRRISMSLDAEVNDRVRRRLLDYLENLAGVIEKEKPWALTRDLLRPKTKNLPQKYHTVVEQVGEAFYRGIWRMPE